jgi:hypothetical protein
MDTFKLSDLCHYLCYSQSGRTKPTGLSSCGRFRRFEFDTLLSLSLFFSDFSAAVALLFLHLSLLLYMQAKAFLWSARTGYFFDSSQLKDGLSLGTHWNLLLQ